MLLQTKLLLIFCLPLFKGGNLYLNSSINSFRKALNVDFTGDILGLFLFVCLLFVCLFVFRFGISIVPVESSVD